jgi:hypothetical protein
MINHPGQKRIRRFGRKPRYSSVIFSNSMEVFLAAKLELRATAFSEAVFIKLAYASAGCQRSRSSGMFKLPAVSRRED